MKQTGAGLKKLEPKPLRSTKVSPDTDLVVSHAGHVKKPAKKKREPESQEKLVKKHQKLQKSLVALDEEIEVLEAPVTAGSEASYLTEYERMLQYNSKLIQRFNEQLRENLTSRDVYALSTLMSQQREVIADLRTLTDMSQQVGLIFDQSVTPFVSDQAQLITDVYYQLRRLLTETTETKHTQFALGKLDELTKQLGLGLQQNHQKLRTSIEGILLGTNNPTQKTVKRKR